jgi:hypothetical protein
MLRYWLAILIFCPMVAAEDIFKPTGIYAEKPTQRQWFLVSESWCPKCPNAKKIFKAKGWPDSNILTIEECERRFGFRPSHLPFEFGEPQQTVRVSEDGKVVGKCCPVVVTEGVLQKSRTPGRYYNYGGRSYDLETYGGCSMRSCGMCAEIRAAQRRYLSSRQLINKIEVGPQAATPDDVIDEALQLLNPNPNMVLWEPGCGDSRCSIAAVQECLRKHGTGFRVIGIEIDPVKADESRRSIADAGLSGLITINPDQDGKPCSDALEFDPTRHGINAAYCYLYPDLLGELADKLRNIPVVVSAGHEIPGLEKQVLIGQCWVYRKEQKDEVFDSRRNGDLGTVFSVVR